MFEHSESSFIQAEAAESNAFWETAQDELVDEDFQALLWMNSITCRLKCETLDDISASGVKFRELLNDFVCMGSVNWIQRVLTIGYLALKHYAYARLDTLIRATGLSREDIMSLLMTKYTSDSCPIPDELVAIGVEDDDMTRWRKLTD